MKRTESDVEKQTIMQVMWHGETDFLVLTKEKVYDVLSVEKGWYRLIDDSGNDYLYPSENFSVIRTKENDKGNYPNCSERELREIIEDCCNDVVFHFNDTACGVTSEVCGGKPIYQSWCGECVKEYDNLDALLNDSFFEGKSLVQLVNIVSFGFY